MHFEAGGIYHIYNQGNNRQTIFFKQENYLFFIKKMREYILPYGDLLCYCLMPNHFHWLVYVREPSILVSSSDGVTKTRSLNESIGILLRSYTRAINEQEGRSGALFREETKAKDGWIDTNISPAHQDYGKIWQNWELYGWTAFQYIHQNPVKAKLVDRAEDWPYSSAPDYAGLRNGTLCNQVLAKELLFLR